MTVALDPRARMLDGGRTVLGGDPWRLLRLTEAGAAALRGVLAGAEGGDAEAAVRRRMIDAGLAHPRPARAPTAAVTVVIPVRDRAAALERCVSALLAADPPGRVVVVDDGSRDPGAVAGVCVRHGCELVRRDRPGGPAAARNAGLSRVAADSAPVPAEPGLVALLDSDCVPEPGWLSLLCGALAADPGLGAVAPRVRPLGGTAARAAASARGRQDPASASGRGALRASMNELLTRFAAVRSPLDLGPWPALVRPGGRLGYVPAAAMLARAEALAEVGAAAAAAASAAAAQPSGEVGAAQPSAAAGAGPFDPGLRYGEDVDLVWRMIERGWSVRYVPEAVVRHEEPGRLGPWLARRFRYGSSAGPLARRHPENLAPVALHLRSLAVLTAAALAAAGERPTRSRAPAHVRGGAAIVPISIHVALTARSLSRHGVPPRTGAALALRGLGESAAAVGRAATMLGALPLAAALPHSRARRLAVGLLLAAPVRDLCRLRPPLDPLRFIALSIADDAAYGAGVWAGALRARTLRPLRPRITR